MTSAISWLAFDLGGVLYQLDNDQCNAAFAQLGAQQSLQALYQSDAETFHNFDRGRINAPTFRSFLRSKLNIDVSDRAIDEAWNALLIDLFPDRLKLLANLRQQWNLALLSNTNSIHTQAILRHHPHLFLNFDEIILSYQTGFRKPETEIFILTIRRLSTPPQHILFIDDLKENIDAAKALGFQTLWLQDPTQLATEIQRQLLGSG